MGHLNSAGAHCGHDTMCPQGRNITEALSSRQILHATLSFNLWFSSKRSSIFSENKTNYRYNPKYWARQECVNSADPDQKLQNMTSDQGIHCLPVNVAFF